MGTKCIRVSKRSHIIFDSFDKAREFIQRNLHYLDRWINIDIPEQSKKWNNSEEFINENQKKYEQIKKAINKLTIS